MTHLRRRFLLVVALLMALATHSLMADTLVPMTSVADSLRQARIISLSDSLHRDATRELIGVSRAAKLPEQARRVEALAPSAADVPAAADTVRKVSRHELRAQRLATFTPDPNKATWSAIVFPGGGQIYNHKYWKLPIVYGGFLGCAYALNWNNQMYSDYSQAYLDIMDDDPGTASYEDFLPPRYNVEANKDYLKRIFKNRKDNYRRQRDMSIFCFIGVYLLSVIDAYVDAELSNFDISEDLSVQVRPNIIDSHQPTLRNQVYGLQCSFSF